MGPGEAIDITLAGSPPQASAAISQGSSCKELANDRPVPPALPPAGGLRLTLAPAAPDMRSCCLPSCSTPTSARSAASPPAEPSDLALQIRRIAAEAGRLAADLVAASLDALLAEVDQRGIMHGGPGALLPAAPDAADAVGAACAAAAGGAFSAAAAPMSMPRGAAAYLLHECPAPSSLLLHSRPGAAGPLLHRCPDGGSPLFGALLMP